MVPPQLWELTRYLTLQVLIRNDPDAIGCSQGQKTCDCLLNHRVVALPLTALRAIPTVVLAAGGVNKAGVIAAALRGGLARVLVSDEATVRTVVGG